MDDLTKRERNALVLLKQVYEERLEHAKRRIQEIDDKETMKEILENKK